MAELCEVCLRRIKDDWTKNIYENKKGDNVFVCDICIEEFNEYYLERGFDFDKAAKVMIKKEIVTK